MLRWIFRKSSRSSNTAQSENSSVFEEISQNGSTSTVDLSNTGVVVNDSNSAFSSSALKLILDNIATREDLDNVLKIDGSDFRQVCEFCKRPFESSKFCCLEKEMHTILINEALQKIRFISAFTDKIPSTKERPVRMTKRILPCSAESRNTFKKLKRKISNFKKYYPYLYNHGGDVLEYWGNGVLEENVRLEVLEFDPKTPVFWV